MTTPIIRKYFKVWEFTDQQGNILYQDTIVDQSTIFAHNWSLTDTINVSVHFIIHLINLIVGILLLVCSLMVIQLIVYLKIRYIVEVVILPMGELDIY